MAVESLLARLERIKPTGQRRWAACCPAHADKSPSLAIRETDDGRVLVHCFAGCSVEAILESTGLTFDDLFPPESSERSAAERRRFFPHDVFDLARREFGVIYLIACDMHKNKTVSQTDYDRLLTAADRIDGIARAAYAR